MGELRYRAFGASRFASGAPGTDYRYTGQRELSEVGLYYYRARWYDPARGRFVQADTVVQGVGAQAWDRYAYVRNSPVRYNDPTGHDAWWCTTAACQFSYYGGRSRAAVRSYLRAYEITVPQAESLSFMNLYRVARAAVLVGDALAATAGGRPEEVFRRAHGPITINVGEGLGPEGTPNCGTVGGSISCDTAPDLHNTLHELGHVFDTRYRDLSTADDNLASDYVPSEWNTRAEGYMCDRDPCLAHSIVDFPDLPHPLIEEFGDMYMNWVMDVTNVNRSENGFAGDTWGDQRRSWMNSWMLTFLQRMGVP